MTQPGSLKIGILSFAHMHAQSYARILSAHPDATLVGAADPDRARGQDACRQWGIEFFPGEEALLAQGLDGVVVTSENVHHRRLVEQAARSGVRAILCEKPLAPTQADAQAMMKCCRASDVSLATAFPCRYSPAFRRAQAQVRAGAIGDILALRGTNRGKMPGGWFVQTHLSGGGCIIDHSVHVADLNRLLLGREAVSVHAEAGHGFYHQTWEDTGMLTIEYDGGVFATLDTSWSRPESYPTWGDVTMQIVGTEGILDLDLFAQDIMHYDGNSSGVRRTPWGSDLDAAMLEDFLRLARGQQAPALATGDDGLRAGQVALAAYRSLDTGQPAPVG